MMRFSVMAAACLLAACGSKNENCDLSKEGGTYKVHWTTKSGNCGDIPDSLINYDSAAASTGGCTFSQDTRDNATCKIESVFTCDDSADGYRFAYTATLTMTADDGSKLDGSISITATYLSTGQYACNGLYDVEYTRQ